MIRIEPETRRVVVGPRRALAIRAASVEEVNWLGEDQSEMAAKVRSLAPPVAGHWDGTRFIFDTPEYGVAPGQAAVIYAGERVVGGGWIETTEAAVDAQAA